MLLTAGESAAGDDAPPGYRVLAVSERPAAGVVDETYESFIAPVLGNGGEVAFTARFKTKVSGQIESALYVASGGSVAPVARRGQPAAGLPGGGNWGMPFPLTVTDQGEVVFGSEVQAPTAPPYSLHGHWVSGAGGPRVVNYTQQRAPGMPEGTTLLLSGLGPRVAGGKTIFSGNFDPASEATGHSAIWAGDVGNVSVVARQHTPAPGLPANYLYGRLDFAETAVNAAGQIAYTGSLVDAGNTQSPHGNGLWAGSPGNPQLMLATDHRAPGVPTERYISFVESVRMAGSGKMAFLGHLHAQTDEKMNAVVVYAGEAGAPSSVQPIVYGGQQAPGFPAGVTFRGDARSGYNVPTFSTPQINSAGQVAFIGSVGYPDPPPPPLNGAGGAAGGAMPPYFDQTENESLWLFTPGKGLKLLLREKDPAPGAPPGYEFRGFVPESVSHDPVIKGVVLNGKGQVAFVGTYAEEPAGPFIPAIWATDEAGNVGMVVTQGQEFDLGDGAERTLSSFEFRTETSSEEGQTFAFNDRGELAFTGHFSDGSTAVVVVTVPEPAGVLALAGAIGVMMGRRRR
jgi:hypothetical protein